ERVVDPALRELADRHPSVGEVRGRGLFWAIELVKDPSTREPLVPFNASGPAAAPMAELAGAARARGVWPFVHFDRLHLARPLVIDEAELRRAIEVYEEILDIADRHR